MNHIEINLFKDSREPFLKMLTDENIEYGEIHKFSVGAVLASGTSIGVSLIQASAPWVAFSAVLVAWIRSRSSRKVIITTKDHVVIHIEGMSQQDVEKILDRVENITVIDTKPPENE
ncbi:hypothetical protein [Uliginosibacterium aquaticum]|uniref:Uncharacterized protein n=1 Tax=Uliginosibacterium aquaticum TaxID=2731212 RepID=A0ABX2IQ91_9RHOO|nr:hypothetical protein [Uliginosibacterium aquaticum]NSL56874.1 hypothetical protein [Uliginosibacterium aquaticum]